MSLRNRIERLERELSPPAETPGLARRMRERERTPRPQPAIPRAGTMARRMYERGARRSAAELC